MRRCVCVCQQENGENSLKMPVYFLRCALPPFSLRVCSKHTSSSLPHTTHAHTTRHAHTTHTHTHTHTTHTHTHTHTHRLCLSTWNTVYDSIQTTATAGEQQTQRSNKVRNEKHAASRVSAVQSYGVTAPQHKKRRGVYDHRAVWGSVVFLGRAWTTCNTPPASRSI